MAWARTIYDRWVSDYRRFARRRGFTSFNDWRYHRRGFIECWWQPGLHRFWQVWNPGIAWFFWRLFLLLGGRRRWALPLLITFVANGFIHTLVIAPFLGRWSNSLLIAFTLFGLLTIVSARLAPFLRQERWPAMVNLAANLALIFGAFDMAFRLDRLI